jgi:hypothetical protein
MMSAIVQHLVNESDINSGKMPILDHLFDDIRQLRNLSNGCSKLPEKLMMHRNQAYRQSTDHEATIKIS